MNEDLTKQRAMGVLSHLLTTITLAKRHEMSLEQLVEWVLNQYEASGYYEEFKRSYREEGLVAGLCDSFRVGRQMLYDDVKVAEGGPLPHVVTSTIWFWDELPAPFLYFEISLEEFTFYAKFLAERNAFRCGVELEVSHENGIEIATFKGLIRRDRLRSFDVVKKYPGDTAAVQDFLNQHWGASTLVSRGTVHDGSTAPAFLVRDGAAITGLVTYHIKNREMEILSLDATVQGQGLGSALLDAAINEARHLACRRVWLITSNDNLSALRFYQRRGFDLSRIHRDAITEARKIKPSIPLVGNYGIPVRHEVELERLLTEGAC